MNFARVASTAVALVVLASPAVARPEPPDRTNRVQHVELRGDVDDDLVAPAIDAIRFANRPPLDAAVVLEIDSMGGDLDAAWNLARAIERSKVPVLCVVDGDALSAASVILESCPTRAMTKRSVIMIHEAAFDAGYGQPVDLENRLHRLVSITRAMVEHYARRLRATTAQITAKIDGGRAWFMNWREAVDAGAVDIVVDLVGDLEVP